MILLIQTLLGINKRHIYNDPVYQFLKPYQIDITLRPNPEQSSRLYKPIPKHVTSPCNEKSCFQTLFGITLNDVDP